MTTRSIRDGRGHRMWAKPASRPTVALQPRSRSAASDSDQVRSCSGAESSPADDVECPMPTRGSEPHRRRHAESTRDVVDGHRARQRGDHRRSHRGRYVLNEHVVAYGTWIIGRRVMSLGDLLDEVADQRCRALAGPVDRERTKDDGIDANPLPRISIMRSAVSSLTVRRDGTARGRLCNRARSCGSVYLRRRHIDEPTDVEVATRGEHRGRRESMRTEGPQGVIERFRHRGQPRDAPSSRRARAFLTRFPR